jgi:hypothetical protein
VDHSYFGIHESLQVTGAQSFLGCVDEDGGPRDGHDRGGEARIPATQVAHVMFVARESPEEPIAQGFGRLTPQASDPQPSEPSRVSIIETEPEILE